MALDRGENVVIEGTQGFGISLYFGSYPYVTSKDTCAAQMAADNGVGPTRVDEVIVVFKAFPTRVGEGPFSTEMPSELAHEKGIQSLELSPAESVVSEHGMERWHDMLQ
jgi:adenylosuccinate synthase